MPIIEALSTEDLNAVASSRANSELTHQLCVASHGRRLALMRAVLHRTKQHSTESYPLSDLENAWALLVSAQRHHAQAAEKVLSNPLLGRWASMVLRRLHRNTEEITPIWLNLGYLHLTAAAAAIRAGLTFQLRVPVWNDSVFLPTLGCAQLLGSNNSDIAELHAGKDGVYLRGSSGTIRLPDDLGKDGAHWQALREILTPQQSPSLNVWLDDLDPYRGLEEPLTPQRITTQEVQGWQEKLSGGWELLVKHHHEYAKEIALGLTTVIPRKAKDAFTPFSASDTDAFGSTVLSLPADAENAAVTLIHEFQHSKLSAVLELVELLKGDQGQRYYAPWRNDPRPVLGLLHGVYSFVGITAYWRVQREVSQGNMAQLAHFEFAHWREQTKVAVTHLATAPELTSAGGKFVERIRTEVDCWQTEDVPIEMARLAREASVDHYAIWRLRNLQVDSAYITELSQAWLKGRPKPPRPEPKTTFYSDNSPFPETPHRGTLRRMKLSDPELFTRIENNPELIENDIPGTTIADLLLLSGKTDEASAQFHQQILTSPDNPSHWIGLGLAGGKAGAKLLEKPESIHALSQEIRKKTGSIPQPTRLMHWFAEYRAGA